MSAEPGARDDAALVVAARRGDSRAFTEIMRRHKEALYRFIRRYVGDAEEAYDLVQETFVSAWSALSDFDTARPLGAWLRRIALNKCRDWSRRRRTRAFFFGARSVDEGAHAIAAPAPEADPREARLAALDAAIARLAPSLKEPLLLTVFEGLSHAEAARALNISAKAVELRVYRARQALAARLNVAESD